MGGQPQLGSEAAKSWRDYFGGRVETLRGEYRQYRDDPTTVTIAKECIRDIFRLAEDVLKKWRTGRYFEFSVFCGRDEPIIKYYWDSSGTAFPKSKSRRDENPKYYREKKYKVIELLDHPSEEVHVVEIVDDRKYSFADPTQRKRIRSTVLYCFDHHTPAALVITSRKTAGFKSTQAGLSEFLQAIGLAVAAEMIQSP